MSRATGVALLLATVALIFPAAAKWGGFGTSNYYEDAIQRFDEGDFSGAIIQLKNTLKHDVSNLSARILLGEAYVKEGYSAAAEKELLAARKLGGDDALIVVPLMNAYLMQNKYDEVLGIRMPRQMAPTAESMAWFLKGQTHMAMESYTAALLDFEKARDVGPDQALPHVGLARVHLANGQVNAAAASVAAAVRRSDQHFFTWYVKGVVERQKNDPAAAIISFSKALERAPRHLASKIGRASALIETGAFEKALLDIEVVRRVHRNNLYAAYLDAVIKGKTGNRNGARIALNDAYALMRSYDRKDLSRNKPLLFIAGLVSYAQGNLQDAVNYLTEYVAKSPHDAGAQALLGKIYLQRGDVRSAMTMLEEACSLSSASDSQLAELYGLALMRGGEHKKATEIFEKAYRQSPDNTNLRTMLALNEVREGNQEKAIIDLETVIKDDPLANRAGMVLALMLLREKRFEETLRVAKLLAEREPKNAAPHNLMGAAYWNLGDGERAKASLTRALTLNPKDVSVHFNLAQIEIKEGRSADAKKRYQRMLASDLAGVRPLMELARLAAAEGKFKDASVYLEKARSKEPRNRTVQLSLIDMYIRANEVGLALRMTETTRKERPDDLAVLERAGRIELAAGKPREAAKTFARLGRLSPPEPGLLQRIAEYQVESGDLEGARGTFQRATSINQDYLPAQIARLQFDLDQKRFEEALNRAAMLAETRPGSAIGEILRGDIYTHMERNEDAVQAYLRGLKIQVTGELLIRLYLSKRAAGHQRLPVDRLEEWVQKNPNAEQVRATLAQAYVHDGRVPKAIKLYEELRERRPRDPEVLNNLAWLYQEIGDERALASAEEAYRLVPENAAILDTLGWLLVEKNTDLQRALPLLRDAHARASRIPEIRYHLAVALVRLGRETEAQRHLDAMLKSGHLGTVAAKVKDLRTQLGK